jgi:hypothetical protein
VNAPTFSLDSRLTAVRLSALRAVRPLPPRKIPGTHLYYEAESEEYLLRNIYFVFYVHIVVFIGDVFGIYLGWNVMSYRWGKHCAHTSTIF